jgi:DNA mismatch endonuclease, patch repair protein
MSANKAKNSSPEIALRKALWHAGLRGYRLYYRIRLKDSPPYAVGGPTGNTGTSSVPERGVAAPRRRGGSLSVRPDISFVSKKLAIFVHGCFWH